MEDNNKSENTNLEGTTETVETTVEMATDDATTTDEVNQTNELGIETATDEVLEEENEAESTIQIEKKQLKKLKKINDKIKVKEKKILQRNRERIKKAKKKKKAKAKKEKKRMKLKEKKAKKKASNKNIQKVRRSTRIRKKLLFVSSRPRLTVYRSNVSIYAQIIDDVKAVTIVAASSKEISEKAKIDLTSVSEIESGLRNPSLKTIYKISLALKVSLKDIFSD